ncbi:peptidylprolyl isomerase [Altererythrobacter aquiaggeris]|uniref:peptidylprolyl isomerase n=1 Tax=Aestuarierythrobacter aquiaggeris TaxID=1898396 RepID=UPI00301618E9
MNENCTLESLAKLAQEYGMIGYLLAVMALALSPAAHAQAAAEPVAAEPGTVLVVLETEFGDIAVSLETERAPISAANFLRYVDEGRFDGTVFYRAMQLDWGDQPNGLVQAGTQYDPERTLPPIAHERTTDTGVLHLRGALSMARNDPGTATGDFSVMLQDAPGMDANPEDSDPNWQEGYAAFGYVIDGMDIIEAIHAAPTDPEKGEGWLKGQMLGDPVVILKARRVLDEN